MFDVDKIWIKILVKKNDFMQGCLFHEIIYIMLKTFLLTRRKVKEIYDIYFCLFRFLLSLFPTPVLV